MKTFNAKVIIMIEDKSTINALHNKDLVMEYIEADDKSLPVLIIKERT